MSAASASPAACRQTAVVLQWVSAMQLCADLRDCCARSPPYVPSNLRLNQRRTPRPRLDVGLALPLHLAGYRPHTHPLQMDQVGLRLELQTAGYCKRNTRTVRHRVPGVSHRRVAKNSDRKIIYLVGRRVSLGRFAKGTCDLGRLETIGIAAPGHLHLFECARRSPEWLAA